MTNTKKIIIIGAGNFGREVACWINHPSVSEKIEIVGFLDLDKEALNGYPCRYKILGDYTDYIFDTDVWTLIAIADPSAKEKIYLSLKNKIQLFTFIFPNVILGDYVEIGPGSILCPNVVIATNVKIGSLVTINMGCQIGHDASVGDYSSMMPSVNIGGACTISECSYFGTGAIVFPKKRIGPKAKIGAGSVVLANVKQDHTVFGNPARLISFPTTKNHEN